MAFRKFKEIGDVLVFYDLAYKTNYFLQPATVEVPEILVKDLEYVIKKLPYQASEAAIGEMILFPILKEVWRSFDEKLMLWSHKSISFNKELGGIPDYMIAKQSKRGKVVLDKPLLAVIEAKKDDFSGGWAQCSLEMVAMQKINENPLIPIYGIVSNGDSWEFAKLSDKQFEQMPLPIPLFPIKTLYNIIYALLADCEYQSQNIISN